MNLLAAVTVTILMINESVTNYTQPVLVYPLNVHGEKELKECEMHQVCNTVYRRLGYPTRAERMCRCKPPMECQSRWHTDPMTVMVDSRTQLKLCTLVSTLKDCTKKQTAMDIVEESEGNVTNNRITLLCNCPSLYHFQRETNITCSRMRASKEGEVCGYVRTDMYATHYTGSCSDGQQCLARDKRTHQRQLLLYNGPVYTARCTKGPTKARP